MLVAEGLTPGCAPCFSDSIKCGTDNCKAACMLSYKSESCLDCVDQHGCTSHLKECAQVDDLPPADPSKKRDEL